MNEEFFVSGNNGISISVRNGSQQDDIFKTKGFRDNMATFSNFRGNILSIATSIESLINSLIEFIIFNEKNDTTALFQNLFLKSNYVNFHNKWKILKELCKQSPKTSKFYKKELVEKIQICIKSRNIFAHGILYYDAFRESYFLEYFENSQVSEIELTHEYMSRTSREFYDCINSINFLVDGHDRSVSRFDLDGNNISQNKDLEIIEMNIGVETPENIVDSFNQVFAPNNYIQFSFVKGISRFSEDVLPWIIDFTLSPKISKHSFEYLKSKIVELFTRISSPGCVSIVAPEKGVHINISRDISIVTEGTNQTKFSSAQEAFGYYEKIKK